MNSFGFDNEMLMAKQQAAMYEGSPVLHNREIIPNLKAQRQELTNRIAKIDTLLSILEKNPDFIRMLDLTRELI